MTIRRGSQWGEPGTLAEGAPTFADDRSAARWLAGVVDGAVTREGGRDRVPEIGLVGGDLHRTLGSPSHGEADLRSGGGVRYPIDLIEVCWVDPGGQEHRDVALAHVVARRAAWWRGRTVVVMNADHVGAWNLGPRAHPDDGRLDVTDGALGWWDRRAARRRAPAGAHVPHPALGESRVKELDQELEPPMGLWLDGERVGTAARLAVRCLPDAAIVVA